MKKSATITYAKQIESSRYFVVPAIDIQSIPFYYAGGYELCRSDYHIARRTFPHWIMEIILSGSGEVHFGKHVHQITAGNIFCYGPEIPHKILSQSEPPLRKYFIASGSQRFPKAWQEAGLSPGSAPLHTIGSDIFQWCDQILQEGQSPSPFSADNLHDLVRILCRKISAQSFAKTLPSPKEELITKAIALMNESLSEIHHVSTLSQRLGISPEYLSRVFREKRNETPYQFIMNHKMNEAFHRLKDGNLSITELSNQLGFCDPFHFSKCFRKHFGYPPSHLFHR